MDPRQFIDDLCCRYDVPASFGERLLPLAQRSREVGQRMQQRILDFIERSFAAEERRAIPGPRPPSASEMRLLRTVASVLHRWTPPAWLHLWAQKLGARRTGPDAGPSPAGDGTKAE